MKPMHNAKPRILVVDDNRSIHEDFRKILCPHEPGEADLARELFGQDTAVRRLELSFELAGAMQGQEALEMVRQAQADGNPFALVFMDVRMPPGWDGIETTARVWEVDPSIQIVICTAYSDYSLAEIVGRLGRSDRFVLLKKPFDVVEVQQLASAFTEKWRLFHQVRESQANLERRVAERTEELARTQARLQHLLSSSPAIIYSTPPAQPGVFTFVSPNVASTLGYDSADFTRTSEFWAAHLHPDDARLVMEHRCHLLEAGRHRVEYRFRHCDGSYHWMQDEARVILDAGNQPLEIVGYCIDITALKETEKARQLMEVQLRQVQKLEAIGQLAAGIAHEINTPIQYVGDNTRFLKDSFESLQQVVQTQAAVCAAAKAQTLTPELFAKADSAAAAADLEYLATQIPAAIKETLEGVERVTRIVRAMKDFSHPGNRDRAPADINRAIESTVTVARNEWKYVAEVVTDLAPDLPAVPCFLSEFNQCILNLIVNAAHAIASAVKGKPGVKGTITISTRLKENHVEVRVSDTGTGIPEENRPRIFEPFFTTKELGKGTGQGLSIVYGSIVKRHGGTVSFETEMGRGTTFIIRLPVVPANTAPPESAPAEPVAAAAGT